MKKIKTKIIKKSYRPRIRVKSNSDSKIEIKVTKKK